MCVCVCVLWKKSHSATFWRQFFNGMVEGVEWVGGGAADHQRSELITSEDVWQRADVGDRKSVTSDSVNVLGRSGAPSGVEHSAPLPSRLRVGILQRQKKKRGQILKNYLGGVAFGSNMYKKLYSQKCLVTFHMVAGAKYISATSRFGPLDL